MTTLTGPVNQDGVPERYRRNMEALSPQDQQRLASSCVALVGLGGLGGYVLELLARAGVGHIRCADGDHFEESNLNRQLLATDETLGQAKSQAARDRAKRINPAVRVETLDRFLTTASEMDAFLLGAHCVVDAWAARRTGPCLW